MSLIHIPEEVVDGKRLGRHMDARTATKRDAGGPPPMARTIVSVAHKAFGLPLNQGNVGKCTAEMIAGACNTRPHYMSNLSPLPRTLGDHDTDKVYTRETANEGQPWPANDPGGTGIYAAEAAIELGICSDYQVATDLDEMLRALVLRPVGTGINWYDSFDSPDSSGVVTITPGAQVRGGHEIVAVAIDAVAKRIGLPNSWGTEFGVAIPSCGVPGGCFWVPFDVMDRLLGEGGDVVVPRTARGWHA
jgi:hypothetical protein